MISSKKTSAMRLLALGLAAWTATPSFAQSSAASDDVTRQIQELRAEQARIGEQQRRVEEALRALEARVASSGAPSPGAVATSGSTIPAPTAQASVASTSADNSKLSVNGDLRFRGQGDYGNRDGADRDSTQIRARLGATYAIDDRVTVGGRLVTGDADDPNSTDVTLSNFDDDLQASLDLAYVQLNLGELKVYGGKIPQPFSRTELVWDGDVNPQGASAVYKHALGNGGAFRANGLFFVVDEQAAGPESTMLGAQLGYESPSPGDWRYDFSAAYYDYRLGSTAGGDAGDFRGNLLDADGGYLSDFDLGDVIVGATWAGLGERWPLRLVGDYVKNFGAATNEDTGWGVDLILGRTSKPHDWRITYGYSRAETDAVFAAFSHDNTSIATNYRLHALTLDYVPTPKTQISAIWYHYQPDTPASPIDDDWLERFRLYFLVNF
jgi:hypothetical protein